MVNKEIAKIFYEMADYLEMDNVAFKPFAYRKAAINLETIEEDVADIYKKGGVKALKDIPGVGKNIAEHIEEYLKTGKIQYYQRFKKKIPIDLEAIISVEGVGPKRAKVLYQKLGIKNLKDLEKRAKSHKIASLFGFGKKTEKNILEGIVFLKKSKGRFLLGDILPKAEEVYEKLKNLKEVERVEIAGSLRRKKETIGDVDFLAISQNPKPIMDFFVKLPGVIKVWAKGTTKASIRLKDGFDMDIRVVPKKSFGAALQYFTGSKEHNIETRKIAMDKGLKLSEYGLFRGPRMVASQTEEDIYKALNMDWMPPELRENQGEIEASLKHKLPELINYQDIRGDLHVHSDWDGGVNSIGDLAKAAQKMGYEYLGISDHTKFLKIEKGLDEKKIILRNKEIDKLNERFKVQGLRFKVLKGCEANILNDGSIDIKDEVLAQLDYVMAGIHSNLKMPRVQMTERVTRAMRNPNVDIISHPTGRLINERDEYQIDLDAIFKLAKETGTILEIDSSPKRLDLKDQNIRRAKEAGVKMIINTDTHRKDQMRFMEFGIAQARRGWAEKEDIVNYWPLEKLLKAMK
ncbi:MAG: DNA polymerase III [Candidatus Nealsonbacteria bacterium RIFCSPLOWO2_01_FULL_41_9]|uniref:DNA polymerase beta n=1 Tax=Candidatus Nealsonbacteria bacterium RIFCSPLOWO2_01_FULL_41_9 TaxID=1801671 RepID=A0A1G2EE73_9BACT|nr:MAG: DNA polymerase III [Candidatus Nealsonbacteria bacterium RIFCSPLOWO2_01_FULL_41_9]